jgi:hypothetical protein
MEQRENQSQWDDFLLSADLAPIMGKIPIQKPRNSGNVATTF